MVATTAPTKAPTNPFVGPRAFKTGEHLYGRSRESSELVDLLIAERIVLLYSPSGAGKSSLINAMIIPKMQEEGFLIPPTVRVNLDPLPAATGVPGFNRYASSMMRSLEDQVPAEGQYPAEKLAGMTLAAYMKEYRQRIATDPTNFDAQEAVLLIIDQFEELVRISAVDQDAKTAFFAQLGEMLRDRTIWALIVIREDYLAAIQQYSRPIPNRLDVTYHLDFLESRAAIEAIQGPARDSGVTFEDDAAQKLVDDLRVIRVQKPDGTASEEHGPYVEPVQLQVVCRRLWDKAADRSVITVQDVSQAGNIDDALSEYYAEHVEAAAAGSGVPERQIREWFDRKLITVIGIRGQVLMEPDESSGLPNKAIKILQESYLVRADTRGNAVWFELAHDRLTRPIRRNNATWFADHLSLFQRQADLWNNQGRPDALLLRGPAFVEGEAWAKEHAAELLPSEKDFLETCGNEYQNLVRARRLNLIIRWAAVGLFALALLAGYASIRASQAADQARKAEIKAVVAQHDAEKSRQDAQQAMLLAKNSSEIADLNRKVAQSISSLSVDPSASITLLVDALKGVDLKLLGNPDAERNVEDALRRALPALRLEQILHDPSIADASLSHLGPVWSASFDRSGRRVATAGDDGTIKVWDSFSGNLIKTITPAGPGIGATSVLFSRDGKLLAAATKDGQVVLYDADSYAEKQRVSAQKDAIWGLAFNQDSTLLALGGMRGFAEVLNLEKESRSVPLAADPSDIRAVAFSPDGTQVAAVDAVGLAQVWDAATGQVLFTIRAHAGAVNGVAFSPDGRVLATSGGDDRLINLWNLADGKRLISISGHTDDVYAIAFTSDGRNLISVSADRTIRVWDSSGRPGLVLHGHTDQIYGLGLSPDGKEIVTTSKDGSARVWDISPEGSREYYTFDNGAPIRSAALNPDGSRLAIAGEDGIVRVLKTDSNVLDFAITGNSGPLEGAAYSPDGREIATSGLDGGVRLWTWDAANNAKLLQNFAGHKGPVWDVVFNPDGTQLATAGEDQTVKVWDAGTGKVLLDLPSKWGPALCVAYKPDGSLLAAGYFDGHVVLWDPHTGKQISLLAGHNDKVRAVAFRPDGGVLASASDDGNIILWDTSQGQLGQHQPPFHDRGDAVLSLAFTKDGNYLFSGGADGIGTLWDLKIFQVERHTYGQTDRINTVGIVADKDGNPLYLYTGGQDGTLRMHFFSIDKLLQIAGNRAEHQITAAQCRQLLIVGCPAEGAAPIPAPAAGGTSPVKLNMPGDPPATPDRGVEDPNSSGDAGAASAKAGDVHEWNRFERPFNSDMSIYYPDIDITGTAISEAGEWAYFSITLDGPRGASLMGNYAVELDMNVDGRSDYLITTQAPGPDWSTGGVRIWEDKNNDVGGSVVYSPDPPGQGGNPLDGFETLAFDQGSGSAPDLAWSRISPTDSNTIQIAVQLSAINGKNDTQFAWWTWASRDPFQPALFDYNDHFTQQQLGSPVLGQAGTEVLTGLVGLDNTCHVAMGFTPAGPIYCKK